MKQIVDKLNKIAKAVDESVTLPNRKLIIDSLDAITDAFGGTKTNSKLIVDKLDDIANCIHGGVGGEWEEITIAFSITNHLDVPMTMSVGNTLFDDGDVLSHVEDFYVLSTDEPFTASIQTYIKKGVDNYLSFNLESCGATKTGGNVDFITVSGPRRYAVVVNDSISDPYLSLELYSDLQ